jgi:hypothetical protein
MQLRFSLPPDESIITQGLQVQLLWLVLKCVYLDSKYKNWWNPPEEVIVVKPREQKLQQNEKVCQTVYDTLSEQLAHHISWSSRTLICSAYSKFSMHIERLMLALCSSTQQMNSHVHRAKGCQWNSSSTVSNH